MSFDNTLSPLTTILIYDPKEKLAIKDIDDCQKV